MGLLSLWSVVALLYSLGVEERSPVRLAVAALGQTSPSCCLTDAAQATADDLRIRPGPPLEPAVSAPPEDAYVSTCRYVGFQTEWVASKRDAGLPLDAVVAAAQRVFAHDRPGYDAVVETIGALVYHARQRTPAALRDDVEAACLARPWR